MTTEIEELKTKNEAAIELERLWRTTITVEPPAMTQFFRWLNNNHICFLIQGILRTAEKEQKLLAEDKVMSQDMAIRWTSKVANVCLTEYQEDNSASETLEAEIKNEVDIKFQEKRNRHDAQNRGSSCSSSFRNPQESLAHRR
jgi:hypothetical protein